jgi:hypothetical protein
VTSGPGYFIPYRYAASTVPCDYPALEPLFVAAESRIAALLDRLATYAAAFDRFGGEPPAPRFEQDWFPRLDACAAYAMVRERRPRRIVEIGCGHSTRVMARAVSDAGLATHHVCIDPAPRARLAGLAVEHHAITVDRLDHTVLAKLAADDILFVDSSHIAVPGSDVDRLVNDVLPRLPAGALIHFHDVFLPHAYPAEWAWRGYNEQLLIAALLAGGGFELCFSSAYAMRHMRAAVDRSVAGRLPLVPGAVESSLWLRKLGSAVQSALA